LVCRKDISTFSQDKNHEISNSAAQNELTLQPDQTVLPEEGSEGDKVKNEVLPITDTHQVGYYQEAPHNVFLVLCIHCQHQANRVVFLARKYEHNA